MCINVKVKQSPAELEKDSRERVGGLGGAEGEEGAEG